MFIFMIHNDKNRDILHNWQGLGSWKKGSKKQNHLTKQNLFISYDILPKSMKLPVRGCSIFYDTT